MKMDHERLENSCSIILLKSIILILTLQKRKFENILKLFISNL
jgi:hypothetical protein